MKPASQPAPAVAASTKVTVPPSPGPIAPPASGEATPAVVDSSVAPSPEEKRLTSEIECLWREHVAAQASFEQSDEEHTKAQAHFARAARN